MNPLACAFTLSFRYEVHFTRGAFAASNPLFRNILKEAGARRLLLVVEQTVAAANPGLIPTIRGSFAAIGIPHSIHLLEGGEAAKENDKAVKALYRIMEKEQLCRHSCVAAIGGGAFLDVAGFAAATFHRGIRHLRLPSTLLGQADAGVGVKNGINFSGKKNLLGTFAPPLAVINDLDLLATLPPDELRAGFSEAVKVAIIRDAVFFEWLEEAAPQLYCGAPGQVESLVRRCAELHVRHIATGGDPFELGSRRPLDFGHWAAHKLEQMSGFRLRHGTAVAIGMALDSVYARHSGYLQPAALERILALIQRLGLPLYDEALAKTEELLAGLAEFREHLGGSLCITLPRQIGEAFEVNTMDFSRIAEAVEELKNRAKQTGQPK